MVRFDLTRKKKHYRKTRISLLLGHLLSCPFFDMERCLIPYSESVLVVMNFTLWLGLGPSAIASSSTVSPVPHA